MPSNAKPSSKVLYFILLFILIVLGLYVAHERLLTISTSSLTAAEKKYDVTFINQDHSFDIVPHGRINVGTGIIFYPGALVDSRAYAPLLSDISSRDKIKVFIVKPYLRLADLDINAAFEVIKSNPEIKNWYVGGHSMGGAAACNFATHNPKVISGLFFFASYCSNKEKSYPGPTLAVLGSNDKLDPAHHVMPHLTKKTNLVIIKGAAHSSFGDYGTQPFDGKRDIGQSQMAQSLAKALNKIIKI